MTFFIHFQSLSWQYLGQIIRPIDEIVIHEGHTNCIAAFHKLENQMSLCFAEGLNNKNTGSPTPGVWFI